MKRKSLIQRWLTLCISACLLLLLPLASPLPSVHAQDGPSPEEPNERASRAFTLGADDMVEATLAPADDVDWYRFDAPQAGELGFSVFWPDPDLVPLVRVWNSEMSAITDWIGADEEGPFAGFVDATLAGPYYFEIVSDSTDASDRGYSFTIGFSPIVDAGEPNNRFGEATWTGDTPSLQANMLPAGDADWYVLGVDDAGELSIEVADVAEAMSLNMRVWNADKQVVGDWTSLAAAGEGTGAVVDLPGSGAYYLEVAADPGQRSAEPYTLTWGFSPSGDLHEPNDRFSLASGLSLEQASTATIFPLRDVDFYAVEVPTQGELAIAITDSPETLDINLRLWNANLDVVRDWVAPPAVGGDNLVNIDLPAAGRYLLEVADGYSDARSVEPYAITATYTSTTDAAEPNDLFSQAVYLEIGEEVPATILPMRDHDWYYVEVEDAGPLAVRVADAPEALDIAIRLWDADRSVLVDWTAPPAIDEETLLVAEIAEPGRYYIEVADGYDDARSVEPYLLRADFPSTGDVANEGADAGSDGTPPSESAKEEQTTVEDGGSDEGTAEAIAAESAMAEPLEIERADIALSLPEGWVREDGEEIVVRLDGQDAPGAPAIRITPASALPFDPEALLAEESGALSVVEEPQTVSIGDATAVVIGLQEEVEGVAVTRRYVLLTDPSGEAWMVVLEADSANWEASLPDLEAILDTLDFVAP